MEQYWDSIKHLSFGSSFIKLETAAAEAILQSSAAFEKSPKQETSLKCVRDSPALSKLAKSIDTIQSAKNWPHIFIRLSSRSPKDAAQSDFRFRPEFEAQLKHVQRQHSKLKVTKEESPLYNDRLIALYRASTYCLNSANGEAAVALLVESKRIREDLKEFVGRKGQGEKEKENEFNVVVREFRFFDPEMEIRAFVHKGKLTALTQYNDLCYFPGVARRADAIRKRIMEQFPTIAKAVPLKSYVLDLVLCPTRTTDRKNTKSGENGKDQQAGAQNSTSLVTSHGMSILQKLSELELKVIEVNPLAEFAGSGMFSWEKPHDNDVLRGVKPFEFRYCEKVRPKGYVLANMAPKWKSIIA